jgi:hypothetical protein
VATVVGGTLKLFTIPPIATGREATLNDMIDCPKAMAIIGSQDCRASTSAVALVRLCAVMAAAAGWRYQRRLARWRVVVGSARRGSTRTGPCPSAGTRSAPRAGP